MISAWTSSGNPGSRDAGTAKPPTRSFTSPEPWDGPDGHRSVAALGAERVSRDAHPRLNYRPELDGLRGVAVLAVMLYHYGVPSSGFLGVDVFFVLSGYLITGIVAAGTSWTRFYRRRAVRLLPAFWMMLAVVASTVPLGMTLASAGYLMNFSMAFDWTALPRSLGHTWSLAAEWQFYLVWPAVVVFLLRRWPRQRVALLALVLGLGSALLRSVLYDDNWLRVFSAPDTHSDGLLIGSALALGVSVPRKLIPLLLIALVPLPLDVMARVGILLGVIGAAGVVSHPPAILAARPLVAVGRISYGLYLWHVPIYIWLVDTGRGGPLIAAPLTFLVAFLSWRYLERPLLRAHEDRRTATLLADDRGAPDRLRSGLAVAADQLDVISRDEAGDRQNVEVEVGRADVRRADLPLPP